MTYFAKSLVTCLLTLLIGSICHAATEPASAPQHQVITVTQKSNIKVVYDVSSDEWEAGVGKALFYVRGLLEAYKAQGVKQENLHISMVLHGAAAYWLLNEENFRKRQLDPFGINPNEQIISELLDHGVSVEICHVTMEAKGWKANDLLAGIKIVHDAYTRLIDLQMQGYAYIYF